MVDKKLEEILTRIEEYLRSSRGPQKGAVQSPTQPLKPSELPAAPEIPEITSKSVVFSELVPRSTEFNMEDPCPLTGQIVEVTMHFPDGCNGLMGLQFGHSGLCMFPSEKTQYISLNNATPTWRNLRESVTKGEKLWANLRNADGINPHRPSIIVTIVGVE